MMDNPSSQEDQQYLEKVRQLSRYIEPLREVIAQIGTDDQNKLDKMKKLMDILSNPNKRMPMETLLKCEKVLGRMLDGPGGAGGAGDGSVGGAGGEGKESGGTGSAAPAGSINPLLEAIIKLLNSSGQGSSSTSSSSELNHALQRSFGAPIEFIYGSDISLPPLPASASKRRREEDDSDSEDEEDETAFVLRREIGMLETQYRVAPEDSCLLGEEEGSDDDSSEEGGNLKSSKRPRLTGADKSFTLECSLEDPNLPSVPPVTIKVPPGYPDRPPRLAEMKEYDATPFLERVRSALEARVGKMPEMFTVTQVLVAWEMSVRAACAPKRQREVKVTRQGVLMGL